MYAKQATSCILNVFIILQKGIEPLLQYSIYCVTLKTKMSARKKQNKIY